MTDTAAAHELALYIENDSELYRSQTQPIIANLKRKRAKGVYNPELAVKLYRYLADSGAKKYTFEFGDPNARVLNRAGAYSQFRGWRGIKGFGIFDVATRNEAARELRDYYDEQVRANPARKRQRGGTKFFDTRQQAYNYGKRVSRPFHMSFTVAQVESSPNEGLWFAIPETPPERLKKNPTRKKYARSRRSEAGFFPDTQKKPLLPHAVKLCEQIGHVYAPLDDQCIHCGKRLPSRHRFVKRKAHGRGTHIKHPRPQTRQHRDILKLRRQYERARRRRDTGGLDPDKHSPYHVQVKRGKKWITLARFPYHANATDYGHALKYRYPSKTIRVFW